MKRAHAEVSLIGAGPGDPGLISVKGLERLREADVILYDHLVNPELLAHARPEARMIPVGKRKGEAPVSQSRINRMLLREARKGLKIARLKGGDPFLFGRGAEEGAFLSRHGVRFEVVPGITSGIACATYAGIPLTERLSSSGVTFVTGHSAKGRGMPPRDWAALARTDDTIVIYMGIANLGRIASELIRHGRSASTPAAAIQWGTLARQKTCFAPLGRLAAQVRAVGISAPAIVVIGNVVRLAPRLNWYGRMPLAGRKIVVTRGEKQSTPLKREFERLGAAVLDIPAIAIRAPRDTGPMDAELRRLASYHWVVLTSANGVDALFGRLKAAGKDARALAACRIAVVGTATRDRLLRHGVAPDFVPDKFTAEDLARELARAAGPLRGRRFLLLRSHIAPPALVERLEREGAEVTQVTAYETHCPAAAIREAFARAAAARPDALTFTSSSTVHHLAESVAPAALKRLLKATRVVSIGPVTTSALRSRGIRADIEARVHTAPGLVAAVVKILGRKNGKKTPDR